ncbi:MAG: hypothetical protein WCF68_11250 [Terriglobales bacterium]
MPTRKLLALTLITVALASLAVLTACSSSSSTTTRTPPSTPVFTSTPVTGATQDVAYTYQLAAVDPAGGSVTFALTSGPTGATISGNTISWTPTAAQSRTSNPFTATATTTSGGTASQSWTVTPGGTITVNWINNYWTANGEVPVPALPSVAANLTAMWTNADGSITVQKSSATSPGVFSIPNVPGGYYWLQTATGAAFWTNTSTFDAGQNIAGGPLPYTGVEQTTQFEFNLSGLQSVSELTPVSFTAAASGVPPLQFFDDPNSSALSGQSGFVGSYIDWTQINTGFLMQMVPESLTSANNLTINNLVLGPSLIATGLSLNNNTNTITETLQTSPQVSIDLNVPGESQWAAMFTNVAPSTPTPFASALGITAQMYVTQGLATATNILSVSGGVGVGIISGIPQLSLVNTAEPDGINAAGCNQTGFLLNTPTAAQPAITTDENFGTLQYGDSFPQSWTRTLSLCQEALALVPLPTSTGPATATFLLVDSATVAPSNTPLGPVVLPVQNPTIDTLNFFGAGDGTGIGTTSPIISLGWTAPTGTVPFGYTVRVYVQTVAEGIPIYAATGAAFSTASTSITLPPLAGGNTYVFSITANADGTANVQTAPFRSSLPTGYATVVSCPVTIGSAAQMPEIHGDRKVITRFSQHLPVSKGH